MMQARRDGDAACAEASRGAQIIMLSGGTRRRGSSRAVRLGAADYVVKPTIRKGSGRARCRDQNATEESTRLELSELRQQLSDDKDRAVWGNSERCAPSRP
jgi:PleD family two-component response regulator